jgi:putative PEP-CTERM system TPR-repeat lipoprotein
VLLGRLYLGQGAFDKAEAAAQRGLAVEPDNIALLEVIGRARLERGQVEKAAETLERMVQIAPRSLQAQLMLSETYRRLGRLGDSREAIETALSIDPGSAPAKLAAARLFITLRDAGAAAPQVEDLNKQFPDAPEIRELRGELALLNGDTKTAIEHFRAALAVTPNSGQLTSALARAQWQADDKNEALKTLEDWLTRNPGDQTVRLLAAKYGTGLERFDVARSHYEQLVQQSPDNWAFRNDLAWLLYSTGDYAGALPEAERAHELAPDSWVAADTLGVILLAQNDNERALKLISQAAFRQPDNPQISFHLAQALARSGQQNRAREILEKILSGDGGFGEREKAEELLDELKG